MQSMDAGVDRLVNGLWEVTTAFADAITGLVPQAAVPTCPEWRVRDLVGHIGQAYRWSAGLVRSRAAVPPPDPRDSQPGRPADWPGWLRDGADDFASAITETGPDTAVWTFIGDRPARFWLRRMVADTVVHVADAAFCAGRPFTIPPDLAAEAISEGLELISAAEAAGLKPALGELRGQGETLAFRPTDVEPGWLVTRSPAGVAWERGTGDAGVVVAAPVADLLLVFSRRTTPDSTRLAITGDRALLVHWWTHAEF
jgi:uncharacterized protein (TIGR03083 family)